MTHGEKKKKEKSRKWENVTCGGMEESGGKFPPLLIKSVNENQIEKKKKKKGKKIGERREKEKERIFRCSDGRSSTIRELKLVHTTRATRGYQN